MISAHTPLTKMGLLTLCITMTIGGLSAGCSPAQKVVNKGAEKAADLVLPPSEEEKLGVEFAAEIEKDAKIHSDPQVQSYVAGLGRKIVQSARAAKRVPAGIDFKFQVIDDPNTINAFAIPGGNIYIYTGLLLAADNEAEVIGVLGHEVAHVTERHVAERLVTAYGLQTVTGMALGSNPGQISQIITGTLANGYLLKYGRSQETESDDVGFDLVVRAGYSPRGMVTFFQKLAKSSGGRTPTFMSSHPDPADRAKKLQGMMAARKNLPTKMGTEDFLAMKPKFKSGGTSSAPPEAPASDNPAVPANGSAP